MEPSSDIPGFVQEGFPRQLPENCVEYILVIINDQLEARRKLSALESVRKRAMQLASSLTKDYIWQRDALNLEVLNDRGLVYLHGSSYFGDAIEDEWLIVYLLRELSKTTNDLWIRVFDSDGEFLLVEAANVLPSWLSPEIDTNRVKLAYILHEKPAAIAPAVEAFYLRDPVSMKSLLSTSGKLSFPPQDLVTVSVKYTKVLFAQLKSQKFTPPPAWTGIMEKAENETRSAEAAQENLARLEVGMKLTCGFEMLASNATTKNNRTAREVAILLEDLEEDGDQALPSDAVIESWPARFESFLNDETAGIEGAELDDMDEDDDSSDYEDSEDEDKDVSFDEEQFANMMREMMGMPAEESTHSKQPWWDEDKRGQVEEVDEQEDEEIRQLATQMEAELNSHGALQLDPTPRKLKALKQKSATDDKGKGVQHDDESEESDDDGEEVDIDYNLAKNLLESFKSQGGTAGPVGNMLGMFGMQLPRDEEHAE
ncbi:hypothetical protein PG984_007435 [Apiospora sp. TS-2023a]